MELLSPAGNYESFIGAINAGADAVYLAGSSYGARAYAENFSDEEILRAIDYAHLLGKKVYLTVNTLIKEKEFEDAVNYIKPFYLNGLDGVIIQDIGLINAYKRIFPKLELHSSTQCFITGLNSAEFFKKMGCSRVVLARELSLEEIVEIKEKTGLEVETFVHGSMCYSYSGDCLYSSCLGSRSGNRGRCAGPCRLSYDVKDAGNLKRSESGYFLSMKDQCTLALVPKLIDASIDSLKIEGRMKKPEYSAFVTSVYRKYIDSYKNSPEKFRISSEDLDKLKSIYMRSQIQEGYYERTKGKEMISSDNPAYNKCDDSLMSEIRKTYLESVKRIPVSMFFSIFKENRISLTMSYDNNYVCVEGDIATKALKSAVSDETIKKSLSKLGDTFFCLDSIDIENDNDSFISIASLNDLRRKACRELMDLILADFRRKESDINISFERPTDSGKAFLLDRTLVNVVSKEQFMAVTENDDIYIPSVAFDLLDSLDSQYLESASYFIELPHVLRKRNVEKVKRAVNRYNPVGFICHNLEELKLLSDMGMKNKLIAGPEIYNWNKSANDYLNGFCEYNILPYELNFHELNSIADEKSILTVYGRIPLMVSENCVQRTAFSCKKDGKCSFTYMNDRKNIDLPVYLSCNNCYNVIYNGIRMSLHEFLVSDRCVTNKYILNFTDEDYAMTTGILSFYRNIFNGCDSKPPFSQFTKSYYNKGVE